MRSSTQSSKRSSAFDHWLNRWIYPVNWVPSMIGGFSIGSIAWLVPKHPRISIAVVILAIALVSTGFASIEAHYRIQREKYRW